MSSSSSRRGSSSDPSPDVSKKHSLVFTRPPTNPTPPRKLMPNAESTLSPMPPPPERLPIMPHPIFNKGLMKGGKHIPVARSSPAYLKLPDLLSFEYKDKDPELLFTEKKFSAIEINDDTSHLGSHGTDLCTIEQSHKNITAVSPPVTLPSPMDRLFYYMVCHNSNTEWRNGGKVFPETISRRMMYPPRQTDDPMQPPPPDEERKSSGLEEKQGTEKQQLEDPVGEDKKKEEHSPKKTSALVRINYIWREIEYKMAVTLVLGDPYVVWSKYYFLIMTTPENNKLFAVSEEEKELFHRVSLFINCMHDKSVDEVFKSDFRDLLLEDCDTVGMELNTHRYLREHFLRETCSEYVNIKAKRFLNSSPHSSPNPFVPQAIKLDPNIDRKPLYTGPSLACTDLCHLLNYADIFLQRSRPHKNRKFKRIIKFSIHGNLVGNILRNQETISPALRQAKVYRNSIIAFDALDKYKYDYDFGFYCNNKVQRHFEIQQPYDYGDLLTFKCHNYVFKNAKIFSEDCETRDDSTSPVTMEKNTSIPGGNFYQPVLDDHYFNFRGWYHRLCYVWGTTSTPINDAYINYKSNYDKIMEHNSNVYEDSTRPCPEISFDRNINEIPKFKWSKDLKVNDFLSYLNLSYFGPVKGQIQFEGDIADANITSNKERSCDIVGLDQNLTLNSDPNDSLQIPKISTLYGGRSNTLHGGKEELDFKGASALTIAAVHGNRELVKLLLKMKRFGNLGIKSSIDRFSQPQSIVHPLTSKIVDLKDRKKILTTGEEKSKEDLPILEPWFNVFSMNLSSIDFEQNCPIDDSVLYQFTDPSKNTCFHAAAISGDVQLMEMLVETHICDSYRDIGPDQGEFLTCSFLDDLGRAEMAMSRAVNTTYAFDAYVAIPPADLLYLANKNQETPLMLAVCFGRYEMVNYLLDALNNEKLKMRPYEIERFEKETTETSPEHFPPPPRKLNPYIIRHIKEKYHTFKDKGLSASIKMGTNFQVDYASISDEELDDYIWSMLNGRHGVSINKDINAQNRHMNTALHLAVISGNVPIIRLLMEKGSPDITLRNELGQTALDIAKIKWESFSPSIHPGICTCSAGSPSVSITAMCTCRNRIGQAYVKTLSLFKYMQKIDDETFDKYKTDLLENAKKALYDKFYSLMKEKKGNNNNIKIEDFLELSWETSLSKVSDLYKNNNNRNNNKSKGKNNKKNKGGNKKSGKEGIKFNLEKAKSMVEASYDESKRLVFDILEDYDTLETKEKVQYIIDLTGKIIERSLCFSACYLQLYWDDIELEAEKNRLLLVEGSSILKKTEDNSQEGTSAKKKNKKTKDREKELKRLERERDQLRIQRHMEAQKELQLEELPNVEDDRYPIPREREDTNVDGSDVSEDSEEEEGLEDEENLEEEDFTGTIYDLQSNQSSLQKKNVGKNESPKQPNKKNNDDIGQKKKGNNETVKENIKSEKGKQDTVKDAMRGDKGKLDVSPVKGDKTKSDTPVVKEITKTERVKSEAEKRTKSNNDIEKEYLAIEKEYLKIEKNRIESENRAKKDKASSRKIKTLSDILRNGGNLPPQSPEKRANQVKLSAPSQVSQGKTSQTSTQTAGSDSPRKKTLQNPTNGNDKKSNNASLEVKAFPNKKEPPSTSSTSEKVNENGKKPSMTGESPSMNTTLSDKITSDSSALSSKGDEKSEIQSQPEDWTKSMQTSESVKEKRKSGTDFSKAPLPPPPGLGSGEKLEEKNPSIESFPFTDNVSDILANHQEESLLESVAPLGDLGDILQSNPLTPIPGLDLAPPPSDYKPDQSINSLVNATLKPLEFQNNPMKNSSDRGTIDSNARRNSFLKNSIDDPALYDLNFNLARIMDENKSSKSSVYNEKVPNIAPVQNKEEDLSILQKVSPSIPEKLKEVGLESPLWLMADARNLKALNVSQLEQMKLLLKEQITHVANVIRDKEIEDAELPRYSLMKRDPAINVGNSMSLSNNQFSDPQQDWMQLNNSNATALDISYQNNGQQNGNHISGSEPLSESLFLQPPGQSFSYLQGPNTPQTANTNASFPPGVFQTPNSNSLGNHSKQESGLNSSFSGIFDSPVDNSRKGQDDFNFGSFM